MENPHIEGFDEALKSWTDERFASKEELRAMAMFHLYLVNLAEDDGWCYDGHSFKVSTGMSCLVVKSSIEGTPWVVFTNGRSSISCIKIFIRKLEAGVLEWREDRYRQ